ncbi:hypothetical protein K0M31_001826 [Melipona bicolor]|uniref:Uncharacterized protein n=1 Tax=Melipona bicolor TaxID=60889 RepID=A0AA40KXZ6_9HYME|nr:hypothetical protein K0M31_001826 [Melipona bicolor]
MEYDKEISSNEDEFDSSLLNDEITSIHTELNDAENKSSDNDSDEVRILRRRKIRLDSDSENDSDTTENAQSDSSEWISCTESEEIPRRIEFILGKKPAGPQDIIFKHKKTIGFFQVIFYK